MTDPSEHLKRLPFSSEKQKALLGHLLVNPQFFKRCKDRIQPEWWLDWPCSKIWASKQNFYLKYKRVPNLEELKASEDWRLEAQQNRSIMSIAMEECMVGKDTHGLDTFKDELTDWLHSRAFFEGSTRSQEFFNQGKFAEAIEIMSNKMDIIKNTNFENDEAFDFSNMSLVLEELELETKNALTFGIGILDKLLLPTGNGSGSLLPGDTTLILGPVNAGKTTLFATIAAANIRRHKSVLFITHEGAKKDIAVKVLCSLLNRNKGQLKEMRVGSQEEQEWLHEAERMLTKYLIYIPMDRPGVTVEEVIATIDKRQEERQSENGGVGFQLVISDYPQKLGSSQTQYGVFNKRNLDEYIYSMFVASALQHEFHCLVAQQTNRAANKINRNSKGSENRLLIMEDANESSGPAHQATSVITINRSPDDERKGIITFYIGKSRSSEKGWAVCCRSNYGNCITHSDSLGGCYYRGDVPLGDASEYLMLHNYNKEIPYKEWKSEMDKKA